jgi:hypothetical protein
MPKLKLRSFRWIGLALFAGATLSLTTLLWTPDLRAKHGASISVDEFARAASSRLRNITVYPPTKAGDGAKLQFVTGEILPRIHGETGTWKSFNLYAPVPFRGESGSVMDFLAVHSATGLYHYAWWAAPGVIVAFWLGTCLLLIAGVVPGAIGVVAAMKRRPAATVMPQAPSSPEPSTAAVEELVEKLQSGSLSAEAAPAEVAPPIKPLSQEKIAEVPVESSDDPKEYSGEYYPVAHPHPETENAKHV